MTEPEFDPRACGSCGQRLARLEVGLCRLCRAPLGNAASRFVLEATMRALLAAEGDPNTEKGEPRE